MLTNVFITISKVYCWALFKSLGQVWWLMLVISALWEAEAGRSFKARSLRPAWARWRSPISTKNTKISQTWWCVPVVPANREAEAGKWLETRRQSEHWAEIALLHFSLGDKVRLHLKKKNSSWKKLENIFSTFTWKALERDQNGNCWVSIIIIWCQSRRCCWGTFLLRGKAKATWNKQNRPIDLPSL